VQGALLLAIGAVAAVYHLLLAGLVSLTGLEAVLDEMLHTVIPVVFALYWLLFAPKEGLRSRRDRRRGSARGQVAFTCTWSTGRPSSSAPTTPAAADAQIRRAADRGGVGVLQHAATRSSRITGPMRRPMWR
jgi:hypothetical protein